jgi:hypothetical protein
MVHAPRALIRKAPYRIFMALTFGSGHNYLQSGALTNSRPYVSNLI